MIKINISDPYFTDVPGIGEYREFKSFYGIRDEKEVLGNEIR